MEYYDCDLILGIMPLVKDGAASDTTRRILGEHISRCESCLKIYASLPETNKVPEREAAKTLQRIRRHMTLSSWSIMIITAIVGSFLTMTEHMGYNVILFPVVGVVAFLLIGKDAWKGIPVVGGISFLWLLLRLLTVWSPPSWSEFGSIILFSLFYSAAYGAGVGITWLIRSALHCPREEGFWGRVKWFCRFLPAILIFSGLLYLCDSFLGNPISYTAVKVHSQAYIEEEYSDLDLELGEIKFDWYSGPSYWIEVTSPGSQDTYFSMKYDRLGRFVGDSYQDMVVSGVNTFSRIMREVDRETEKIRLALEEKGYQVSFNLNSDWPSIYDGVIEYPFGPEAELKIYSLMPDGEYSVHNMVQTYGVLDISIAVEEATQEELKRVLLDVKECYRWMPGPRPNCVDVQLYSDDASITVKGFPYEQIGERRMEVYIRTAVEAWEKFEAEYEKKLSDLNS